MSKAARAISYIADVAPKSNKQIPPMLSVEDYTRFKSLSDLDIEDEVTLTVKAKVVGVEKSSGDYPRECMRFELSGIKVNSISDDSEDDSKS